MREDREHFQPFLRSQSCGQRRYLLRQEAQAMHAAIDLQMNRVAGNASPFGLFDIGLQDTEVIDFGLQVVRKEFLKAVHLWVEDHHRQGDAFLSEMNTLLCHRNGQVIAAMILQRFGNLHSTRSIAIGFHHADQLGVWWQFRLIKVEIVHHCIQVHFQLCLMNTLLQQCADPFKVKFTRPFQQDQLSTKRFPQA